MPEILRQGALDAVRGLLRRHRVVGLVGARQVGKTTLARQVAARHKGAVHTFDLEDPADRARLADPALALRPLRGLVVLDEIQRLPDLFPVLRVLADRPRGGARFLVLGSASPDLLRQTSESLAGRIVYVELDGFGPEDVGWRGLTKLWVRGGFPRSFLARSDPQSLEWRLGFVRTFLERDLPQLGISIPATTLERFWAMLAHYHGRIWNASAFSRSFGVSDSTVRRYLDLLTRTYVVRQMQPFHENLRKRQVRSPKVYLTDTGLLHALLNLPTLRDIERHPVVGASWESLCVDLVMRRLGVRADECYFWATHAGAELDLVVVRGRRRLGFEFKRTEAPRATRSIHVALTDLRLSRVDIVHAGDKTFALAPKIRALALRRLPADLSRLR